MKQPTKPALRDQLALAATEIIRLREDAEQAAIRHRNALVYCTQHIEYLRRPWWRRIAPNRTA